MWSYKDEEGTVYEFRGTQNNWIKRIGLFLLIMGLFPKLMISYHDEMVLIWEILLWGAFASYIIYHIRGFFKSTFGSKA